MIIPVNTTYNTFSRQLLELLRGFPPLSKLRSRELDVLAEVLKQNDALKGLDPDIRNVVLFSTDSRKQIYLSAGVSEEVFNNIMVIFRKNKIVSKDNKLNKFLSNIFIEDNKDVTFKFKIS
jgi:hypothetical protein